LKQDVKKEDASVQANFETPL